MLNKKHLINFLSILLLTIIPITNSNANIMNKFKEGFYFEKYETAEEAKEELLKLHPIGSDVDELVKILEVAGANVKKINSNYLVLNKRKINKESLIWYIYIDKKPNNFFSKYWDIFVEKHNNEISDVIISYQTGE